MRAWFNRLAIALLAVSLVQAGVAACCWTPGEMNAGRHDSHHAPRSSHVVCAPTDAVKGAAAQSSGSQDQSRLSGPVTGTLQTVPFHVVAATAAVFSRETIPWVQSDLFLRIHVLLI
jgi:hypothetical protein